MPVSPEGLQLDLLEYKQWALPPEATARTATLLKKQKGKCAQEHLSERKYIWQKNPESYDFSVKSKASLGSLRCTPANVNRSIDRYLAIIVEGLTASDDIEKCIKL